MEKERRQMTDKDFSQEDMRKALSSAIEDSVVQIGVFLDSNPGTYEKLSVLVGDTTINRRRYYVQVSLIPDMDIERPNNYNKIIME